MVESFFVVFLHYYLLQNCSFVKVTLLQCCENIVVVFPCALCDVKLSVWLTFALDDQ